MHKIRWLLLLIIFIHIVGGCRSLEEEDHTGERKKLLSLAQEKKPVIMIIIDSLMDQPLQKAIDNGDAPTLKFLLEHGQYYPDVISSFPTMSVTIESTLLTGTYPDRHQVPGLVWYDEKENRIINYGNGKREMLKIGIKQIIDDTVYQLNNEHLNKEVKTVYEELASLGKNSASINNLVHRGNMEHFLTAPKLAENFHLITDEKTTFGPKWFSYGGLKKINPDNHQDRVWQNLGFNDKFAAEELIYLIKNNQLPSFTLVYFPDHDHTVHKNGPMDTKGIKEVDQQLQNLLKSFGTIDQALDQAVWIVMGDSGQSAIGKDKEALIPLLEILKDYRIAKLNKEITNADQIILAVNERMAYVYSNDPGITLTEIASVLQTDERIDLIALEESSFIHVLSGNKEGKLSFHTGGPYKDSYRQNWTVEGNIGIMDLMINPKKEITYHAYPDGLARLNGALHSHQGNYLVITSAPGFEFIGESSPTHLGGAGHGSLHLYDSLVPMIVTGTSAKPESLRIIDLKDWLIKLVHNQ